MCAECHNKSITTAFHLENVRRVQEKIMVLQNSSVENGREEQTVEDETPKTVSKNQMKHPSKNKKQKPSNIETFEENEDIEFYDINLKRNVPATVVSRVTYGQYAIRVNGRIVVRIIIHFDSKKN